MNDAQIENRAGHARDWGRLLSSYREFSGARSTMELAVTAGAFVLVWIVMWASLKQGYVFTLMLAVPAAGLLLRLFMI